MVYKRYIKQNGKSFGPYYYSSHRKGKKIVSKYLPEYKEETSNLFNLFALGFIFLFIMFIFLITGVDYKLFNQDSKIVGNVIKEIPNTDFNLIYQLLNPWILLIFFFIALLFLGHTIKKKKEKNRINRIADISYFHSKEETQKLIKKLLPR